MENYQPTEKELKSLNLFSYYIKSNGCKSEATSDIYFYEDGNNVEFYDLKYWNCKGDRNSHFESYESITEVLENIISQIDIPSYLEGGDDESRGNIELSIDVNERKLEIKLYETVRGTNETGTSWEFNEGSSSNKSYPSVVEFFNTLESSNIKNGEVQFDGGGDSGEIYDNMTYGGGESIKVPNEVLDFLYSALEDFYGGWEINEGSHGYFVFYTKTKEVALNFYEHTENTEDRGKILHIDF